MATKKARRRAARYVKSGLGLYLYTLEPWFEKSRTPEEVRLYKRDYLLTARAQLDALIEMEEI